MSETIAPAPAAAAERTGPLDHLRVLDLTRVRAGPAAVRQLADWGADVIKIEPADADLSLATDRDGPDFQNLQRNKRSIVLDLKSARDHAALLRLAAEADVVVENFRPDVKDRLGIGYDAMRAVNPRLIYASISGFGQTGPYCDRPGFDQILQGMGGLMAITGLPGQGPVRAGIAVADMAAGLYCAIGILIAVVERERSGLGQWVTTSLLESQIALLDFQAARWLIRGEVPEQAGNDHPTMIPTGVFATADEPINVAAISAGMWRALCAAIGRPALIDDPRFATAAARSRNRAALNAILAQRFAERPAADWIAALNAAGVACGPIYRMDRMFADPQVRHLDMVRRVTHPRLGTLDLVGQPVSLSRTPSRTAAAAPERGEHTAEILAAIGIAADE